MDGANIPKIPKEGPPQEPIQAPQGEVETPSAKEIIHLREEESSEGPKSQGDLGEFKVEEPPSQFKDNPEPQLNHADEFTLDNIAGDINTPEQASRLQEGLSEIVGDN